MSRREARNLPLLLAAVTALMLAVLCVAAPLSDAAKPKYKLKLTYRHLANAYQPTDGVSPPGYPGLLYVAERTGKIRILKKGDWLPNGPFLDISDRLKTLWIEQGLLGLAFPPDFKKSHRYYVHYVARNGDILVEEYQTLAKDPTTTKPESRRLVLRIPKVNGRGNHNGGELAFLGDDLFISVGDGNDPGDAKNLAQNIESLRGKILRIDPRGDATSGRTYTVPASNPFVNKPGRDEIFAYGFRNPHSFDFYKPKDGDMMMAVSDVGQGRSEELNILPYRLAWGANFGWKLFEGILPYDCGELCPNGITPASSVGLTWPQLTYSHERGCAIIAGPIVKDPSLKTIRGRVIYGDFCQNRVRTAALQTGWVTDDRPTGMFLPPGKGQHSALNALVEDGWGRIFALSNFGDIYLLKEKAVKVTKPKPKPKPKPGKKPNKKKQQQKKSGKQSRE